jgi:hypothetical protein
MIINFSSKLLTDEQVSWLEEHWKEKIDIENKYPSCIPFEGNDTLTQTRMLVSSLFSRLEDIENPLLVIDNTNVPAVKMITFMMMATGHRYHKLYSSHYDSLTCALWNDKEKEYSIF